MGHRSSKSLRCSECNKVLPALTSPQYKLTVRGRSVNVFNGGEYYGPGGRDDAYQCEYCFNDFKWDVLIQHLDEYEANYESGEDELLEILSLKSSIPVSNLRVAQLTADELRKILSVLEKLLFDEWISAPPSHSTLQHTQVFITELCALSLEIPEEVTLQNISNHVQSLVESISQSASNVFEGFLLTQALYLNLAHFLSDHDSSDTDAVIIAKKWAQDELPAEKVFLIEFLSTLTSSLQKVVGGASVFILKMEIQCLKLLLSTLTHLNDTETHSESTEMLLRLVQTNQWTPTEAMTLLKALSQKYADDGSMTEVLMLAHVYDVSPEWMDDSRHSLIQAIRVADPEMFRHNFQNTLRKNLESSLGAAIAELKMLLTLDDHEIEMIKNIITGVLPYPKYAPFNKDSFKHVTLNAEDLQNSLSQLCKAVFDNKGWWPTVRQMVRWCVLMLTERSEGVQLVSVEEDPCVTAMFAATQVCMGNKVGLVLHSQEQTMEWYHFYRYLGISLDTNMKKTNASFYEADIVYGTISDFVCDYLQHNRDVMETRNLPLSRRFIIEEQSLSSSHHLELSRLRDNGSLVFAAEVLQSLMGKFHNEDMELRHRFIKALFQVFHTYMNNSSTDDKIIGILLKMTGQRLSIDEFFILTFLESLLKAVTEDTESERNRRSPAGKWCLDKLFACTERLQASTTTKEVFQLVSSLVAQSLWSPAEALNLLGALTNLHHDRYCTSIMKILHLMATYQVSTKWTDENQQSLLTLLHSSRTENLIQNLEKSLRDEKMKSIDTLIDEIRQMGDTDEETLRKTRSVVTHVTNLIDTGEIKNHTDVQRARILSHSTEENDLQEVLAVLCNAVHLHRAKFDKKWWPRTTQMMSWCLLALSDTGKLLEMGTGEGKSCVIAMFAVLRVLRGEKVDVVSSSSVLSQRDVEKWDKFYKFFDVKVDTNTNKTEDKERKECYQKDVVYGTIEAFAADHLRQTFEMEDVRPHRGYQCIIIDEVDSLLLDQGVQLTYLSSPMVSMQHLNVILAMIWGHVRQYGFLSAQHQTFVRGPPVSFFKAIFDSIDPKETGISDPKDILRIAEESNTVPKGFTDEIYKSEKDELLHKLKTVSQEDVVRFFQELEDYIPCGFTVYTLDDKGFLHLRKRSPYNNPDIPELKFLVLEDGLCCPLYDSEETLIKPIAELISKKIQYTPCADDKNKISIPGFLKNLVEKKVSVWVQNAFLAMQLKEEREYVVENNNVCPVDFRSTGIVELNKKWGDGLQQFVEIKHQIKLSTISVVTNYISNISFFEKYSGKIYGATGTLGSKTDMLLLQDLYPTLSACKMPTFNRKKLFEVKGTLKTSAEEWKSEIKRVVTDQIYPNSYRGGRAALVICETINKAKELHNELTAITQGKVILYCRSDPHSLSKIDEELHPGDVIVATNLAGRGTNINVSKQVNDNGGLFVILSFLSENTRVELQAFGRTARKGKPGSAQVIASTEHLSQSFRNVSSLEEAKSIRDRLAAEKINDMMSDVAELKLREDLFSEYCKTLGDIRDRHKNTDGDEKRAVVAIMNEFWGIWLQIKSEEIQQLKRNELLTSLKADLEKARNESQRQTSPCSSIYHYIKFGNVALSEKKWDISIKLFEKAMELDESWAAIAFYNHAFCTIKQQGGDYLNEAKVNLEKAQKSLKYLSDESVVCLQLVKMSSADSAGSDQTSLEKQLTNRCSMLAYFDKNINETIQKLDEIKKSSGHAHAKKSPIFSLVSKADEDLQEEANNLYSQGLKYIFSVEEKPRFSWEGLLVFCLGVLQIIGGTLLTVFTYGALAQVGMGLITEGISDCINGIQSMVTREFSWKSWAIDKAISIGVSLIGFGVGKLIAKGFKASKMAIKGFGKQLKSIPKFVSTDTGLSVVAKTNIKNAVTHTAQTIVEEAAIYGLGKAEEKLLTKVLESIKNDVKKKVVDDVRSNMEKEPLASLVDSIILSHLQDKERLHHLLQDEKRKNKLLDIFKKLSNTAVQPFCEDLSWQNKLNSSISEVIDKAKAQTKGTAKTILTVIQGVHMTVLAGDAISTVRSLSSKFFSNLREQLDKYKKEKGFSEKVMVTDPLDTEIKFKQDLFDSISTLLANALVEVFHQKFSSHIVSRVQGQVHDSIRRQLRAGLKSDRTEEKLRAGQNNRYITYMPGDPERAGAAGELSRSHAEKIKNPGTAGTILDIRVLSETTDTKVVILTEDSHGRFPKMQEVTPSTGPASQTVTLIYRPKSAQYPDGHYDVRINNQTVRINSEDKNCLFHALARGRKPEASEREIIQEAARLRSVEANALLTQAGQWEPFIKRKEWTQAIRGGDWYMTEGAAPPNIKKIKESKLRLKQEVGKIEQYKEWQKYAKRNSGVGRFINADHQPPVNSIWKAGQRKPISKLAKAMLEVATNTSPLDPNKIPLVQKYHGLELPTVYVPHEVHYEFPSTKSEKFRTLLTDTIDSNNVVNTFKLTIIGAMPRFRLNNNKGFKTFTNTNTSTMSETRLKVFEKSLQQHSIDMVETWFNLLQPKGAMTGNDLKAIKDWINKKGYKDRNDPNWKKVSNLL